MVFLLISTVLAYLLGRIALGRLEASRLLRDTASYIIGTVFLITLVYTLSVVFARTADPIFYGTLSGFLLSSCVVLVHRSRIRQNGVEKRGISGYSANEVFLILSSVAFSSWMMFKSFRQGAGSTLLVGSNEVFDMGHSLGIVRSFSWGNNIPFLSPYVAGQPHLYHFMFYFWAGLLEKYGLPLVWALNIPSIVGFASFMIVAFYLPIILFKASPVAGWITVLLSVTHPTLTFVYFLLQKGINGNLPGVIWHLSKYPFAAPYDQSTISLFFTLNVFVNQRHFAFALAGGLIIYLTAVLLTGRERKNSYSGLSVLAIISGLLAEWHIVVSMIVIIAVLLLYLFQKKRKPAALFFAVSCLTALPWAFPWILALQKYAAPVTDPGKNIAGLAGSAIPLLLYLRDNFGALLLTVPLGLWYLGKRRVRLLIPIGIIMVVSFLMRMGFGRDIDQKFLNFWIVFANAVTAYFLIGLFFGSQLKRFAAICLLIFLTASGFIDIMVIKNDFAYPVADAPDNRLISYLRTSTPQGSVILSYQDIFDPVALAGRFNYWGYFRNMLQPDRNPIVKKIYENPQGSLDFLHSEKIRYIIIPLGKPDKLPYTITLSQIRTFKPVYTDKETVLYQTY